MTDRKVVKTSQIASLMVDRSAAKFRVVAEDKHGRSVVLTEASKPTDFDTDVQVWLGSAGDVLAVCTGRRNGWVLDDEYEWKRAVVKQYRVVDVEFGHWVEMESIVA